METTEDRVKLIFSGQIGTDIDGLDLNGDLVETYCLDSLDFVETIMELEDEFDITIPEDEFTGSIKTIHAAIDYIKTRVES